jgi:cell division protein FtsI (penicillin-binding protein 3)
MTHTPRDRYGRPLRDANGRPIRRAMPPRPVAGGAPSGEARPSIGTRKPAQTRPPAGTTQRTAERKRDAAAKAAERKRARKARKAKKRIKLGALHGRVRYGFAAVCTLLLVIGGRLVQLQGIDHGQFAAASNEQSLSTITLTAKRGEIVDRNGTVLAYSSDAKDITADPTLVNNKRYVTDAQRALYGALLSPLLGVSEAQIEADLNEAGRYVVLAKAIDPALAQKVAALNLVGIFSQDTTTRMYPGGTTAANILGTVHADGSGAAGIEQEFNNMLKGKDGSESYSIDNQGNINPSSKTITDAEQDGATVALTIDQQMQFTAQRLLDETVASSGARGAQLAALDAKTGQVLALASSGTFDASNPNSIDPNKPINPPVMSAFEPGSVQKAITFAAAIQEKKITPDEVFNVPNEISMGGVTIGDAWWHPTLPFTATGILAESSNVGTLQIAKLLGPKLWFEYEKRFSVGQATGIELPGESSGYLPSEADWSDSSFSNLPFGQGESMTVLQLASIYQTFANDGVQIAPRIVSSVTKSDGTVVPTEQPQGKQVITAETAKTVRTMLESVVMPGGTGIHAAVPGYRVAGKTGTAQQPDPNNGGRYSDYMNWDTFAGMLPADDPQVVIAIMVDNPAHGVEGGDVAAPLFSRMASYIVSDAHIAPTGSIGKHVPLEDCNVAEVRIASPSTVC